MRRMAGNAVSPELAHTLVEGVVAVVTAYVGLSQRANRRKAKGRDEIEKKRLERMDVFTNRVELGIKELAGQVGVLAAAMGDLRGDVKVLRAEVDFLKREVERLRGHAT